MDGVCEEKVSRGRRFFLLGALALPVAAKIERIGRIVAPPPEYTMLGGPGSIQVGDSLWVWSGVIKPERVDYVVTRVNFDYSFVVQKR